MEKNRLHPTGSGKNIRMSFQRQKEVLEMPNLKEYLPFLMKKEIRRIIFSEVGRVYPKPAMQKMLQLQMAIMQEIMQLFLKRIKNIRIPSRPKIKIM